MKVTDCVYGASWVVVVSCLVQARPASAVTLGQIDTFEDGTTQNWTINLLGQGSPPPAALPANIPTGGPGGADDNYLRLASTGQFGAGGRLVAINVAQWTGDYLAAGVAALRMDVNNLGAVDLHLRLLFGDPAGGPASNEAISTVPVIVPAGSGWVPVTFPVEPADLTAITGDVAAALANATLVRLLHSTATAFPPDVIAASVGVDNILAVPEPSVLLAMAVGLPALLALRRRP